MQFKDIIGHSEIKKQLIEEVNEGRIPNTQLFQGPTGAGAFPLALAYAQYINCSNKKSTDSCGKCLSCKQTSKLIYPDLHFSFPITTKKAKNKHYICDDFLPEWRRLVTNQSYFNFDHWLETIDAQNSQPII